jgi:hypothetical protein
MAERTRVTPKGIIADMALIERFVNSELECRERSMIPVTEESDRSYIRDAKIAASVVRTVSRYLRGRAKGVENG